MVYSLIESDFSEPSQIFADGFDPRIGLLPLLGLLACLSEDLACKPVRGILIICVGSRAP